MSLSGSDLEEAKQQARHRLRQARASLPRAERNRAEARIVGALDEALRDVAVVGLYAAAGSEVSLDALAARLEARGVDLAWPRVDGDELRLHIAQTGSLRPGYRGLREPAADAGVCTLEALDVLIVPGVGFDRHGRRLGQGGGFYDRLLGDSTTLQTIGVAFAVQIVPVVPTDATDLSVGTVVTEIAQATRGSWRVY